jgi:hypothetical protein
MRDQSHHLMRTYRCICRTTRCSRERTRRRGDSPVLTLGCRHTRARDPDHHSSRADRRTAWPHPWFKEGASRIPTQTTGAEGSGAGEAPYPNGHLVISNSYLTGGAILRELEISIIHGTDSFEPNADSENGMMIGNTNEPVSNNDATILVDYQPTICQQTKRV